MLTAQQTSIIERSLPFAFASLIAGEMERNWVFRAMASFGGGSGGSGSTEAERRSFGC